jgi:hypothetical protein
MESLCNLDFTIATDALYILHTFDDAETTG